MLPWHGQLMVPSATSSTVHPLCVKIAEKPLNSPADGCVTTISSTITPEPTGTSAVVAIAFAGAAGPGALVPGAASVVVVAVSPDA